MSKAEILKLLQKDPERLYDDPELCAALGVPEKTKETPARRL